MTGSLPTKWFLLCCKLRFLATPERRRVRLELETEGRQITFLLVSLHELGYAIRVVASPMVFGDLLALRKSTTIPFITGDSTASCGCAISDSQAALDRGKEPHKILLNYDFFNPARTEPRMPYFMHPSIYRNGLQRLPLPDAGRNRTVRVGFYGTRDRDFYTRSFHFEMLDRERILEWLVMQFKDRIWRVDAPVEKWTSKEIALAIDERGGDREGKTFLPLTDYLIALRDTDFFLSPPGWCMPLSHNLIEGMAAASIPILNCPDFLNPPLEPGVNCLAFHDPAGLSAAIRTALEMPAAEIERLRRNVAAYYSRHLAPGRWLGDLMGSAAATSEILVNAEEVSMRIREPGHSFTPAAGKAAESRGPVER